MTQLNLQRFIFGPLATITLTIIYHLTARHFGWTFTVGAIWVAMIVGSFIGGFRSSLIAAVWAGIYSYYVMPLDTDLWVQRVIWGFALAGTVGLMRRRERRKTSLLNYITDGSGTDKVVKALDTTRRLKASQPANVLVGEIESELGNYLALTLGYRHLWQEIQEVEKWYKMPGNLRRWQEWNEERGL